MEYSLILKAYDGDAIFVKREIYVGDFEEYPSDYIDNMLESIMNNIDITLGLDEGDVIALNLTVAYDVVIPHIVKTGLL